MRDITEQLDSYQDHIDALYPAVTVDDLLGRGAAAEVNETPMRSSLLRTAAFSAAFVLTVGLGALTLFLRGPENLPVAEEPLPTEVSTVPAALTTVTQPAPTTTAALPTTAPPALVTVPATVADDGAIVLTEDSVGPGLGAAVGPQGRLNVAYWSPDDGLVKLLRCTDAQCAAPIETITLGQVSVGRLIEGEFEYGITGLDLVLGPDGSPIVIAQDWFKGAARIFACADPECATVDTAAFGDEEPCISPDGSVCQSVDFPQMAIGPDGLPRIVYYHTGLGQLKLAVCGDPLCEPESRSTITIDHAIGGHGAPSIRIEPDGMILIGHESELGGGLVESRVAVCTDSWCTGGPSQLVLENAVGPRTTPGVGKTFYVWYRSGPLFVSEGDFDPDAVLETWDLMVAACDTSGCREAKQVEVGWGLLQAWPADVRLDPTPDGTVAVTFGYWFPGQCTARVEVATVDPTTAAVGETLSIIPDGYLADSVANYGSVMVLYDNWPHGLRLMQISLNGPVVVYAGPSLPGSCTTP